MFNRINEFISILLGVRKLLIMSALIVIAMVFRVKNLIDGAQMTDLLKGTVLGFFAANASEHIKSAITSFINAKGQKVEEEDISLGDENAK